MKMTDHRKRGAKVRKVTWIPQHDAEDLLPVYGLGMISITGTDRRRARLRKGWRDILRLVFDDIEAPVADYVLFDDRMADRIIDWLYRVDDRVEEIIVHCSAGISRSAAVARFVAERYGIEEFDFDYRSYNLHVYDLLTRRYPARRTEEGAG
ncbi:MAG: hypothetical protein ACYC9V_09105 [Desulfobacteria bacterium]